MVVKSHYLINEKTILFYGKFYENGELFTFVIDGDDCFLVAMSPVKLINKSLISYGGNFEGALESSRALLGENRKMYPIKITASMDIWIFPTKSYKNVHCVCFVLNHVKNTKSLGTKQTKVFLSNGHEINIKMRESSFRNKRSVTSDLRDIITSQKSVNYVAIPQERFIIIEEKGQYDCKARKIDK